MGELWQQMGDDLDVLVGQFALAIFSAVSAKAQLLHFGCLLENGNDCLHVYLVLVHAEALKVG